MPGAVMQSAANRTTPRRRRRHLAPAAWLLTACLLSLAPPSAAAATQHPLDVLPPVTWRHALAWTLSSDDVLFGHLDDVDLLGDGTLAVTDVQLGQVLLITGGGAVQDVLAVAGEGPGRLTRLAGLVELPGEGLLLVQAWPGRGEVIARDGAPVRSWRPPTGRDHGGAPTYLGFAGGYGLLVGVQAQVRPQLPRSSLNILTLGSFDPTDLRPQTEILRREFVTEDRMGLVDETAGHFPVTAWAIADSGRVVVAPDRETYRLELYDLRCGRVSVYTRERLALPRPQAEKDHLASGFSLEVDGRQQEITFIFHETAEMIQQVTVLSPGRLLLQTAYTFHDLPDGQTARLDLVDLDRATVQEVLLSVPLRPLVDRLVVLAGGHLVVLKNGGWTQAAAAGAAAAPADLEPPGIQSWTLLEGDPR